MPSRPPPPRQPLPLFPLGRVLFPGQVLPLHVFEDRYRHLVRDLMDGATAGAPRQFGVVAIRSGSEVGEAAAPTLYPVGCTAVLRVVKEYDDGRFDIVTSGAGRFRVGELDRSKPYLQADVEPLAEAVGEATPSLAMAVARRLPGYRAAVLSVAPQAPKMSGAIPTDPAELSYLVAASLLLDLPETQGLLEIPTAGDRLRRELFLLRRETGLIRHLRLLPAIDAGFRPFTDS